MARKQKKGARAKKSESGVVGRNELVDAVAKQLGVPKTHVLAMVTAMCGTIKATVKAGTSVRINGFGSWRLGTIKARRGRVFNKGGKTTRAVNLPATTRVVFKGSGSFLD